MLPFIAFLPKHAHFVVVWQKTPRTVLIGEPGIGLMTVEWNEFLEHWDGITIVLRPRTPTSSGGSPARSLSTTIIVRRLFHTQWGGWHF
ncbi:hypothetical protein TPY_0493 [Sulfobacillus acidophilus TPY]|nr:hypothetical protein TPY_0493 [Sulfobacillus acidophilus TPY]